VKRAGKVGRNERCPCGSGRKYKKCHWNRESAAPIPYHESAKELLRLRVGEQKCLHPMLGKAQELATERYRAAWLALFAGMTKKAAWQRYTGGTGYPTLGTFYRHVKHAAGLSQHLEWCLRNDLERSLKVLGIEDAEIKALLKERTQLWKPTSGPM
jgi:SEC-C motif